MVTTLPAERVEAIRIGCVKYLNTLPLIEGLQAWRGAEIVPAAPSALIDLLLDGDADVALASVIDAARNASRVRMLPVGMIGCDGRTLTVRLFSKRPISEIRVVGADTESHTSVVLLRVLLARLHGITPRIVDYAPGPSTPAGFAGDRPTDQVDALLLIGDKVVTDPPVALAYPHELDLGEAWKRLTGLPFVYAVWMCRTGEEDSIAVRTAAAALDRTRRHNATRIDWLVAARADERRWPRSQAREYLGELLRYEVDERARAAVIEFFRAAREVGALSGFENASADPRWAW